jgi:hypothetical protein
MLERERHIAAGYRARIAEQIRQAATSALTGFQSAIVRSHTGMPSVGTKVFEIILIGKTSGTY